MSFGNRFCNVDLHVHTPQSECFTEHGVTPEMIVAQALEAGMKAIAITDHNSAEWVDLVKEAAVGTGLTVFPGVEITVQPGVHVVAIFPEDYSSANVTDLLSDLGLKANDRGKNDSLVVKYGIQEVVSIIKKNHALPVLAHIDDEKGAWKVLAGTGQTFVQFWETGEFAAVEIVGDHLPEAIGKDPFTRIPACYWASDNPHPENPTKHSHKGIGKRYSQLKLAEPITWEGLRLCFQDPSARIRPAVQQPSGHPIIESISINGGFLDGFNLELNPNLNCIIGGRGTGKSCLLEVIRHNFNAEPKTKQNQSQAQGVIEHTFPPGSNTAIQIRVDHNATYRVERSSGGYPIVYRDGEEEILNIPPGDLLPIQVYGQKEVYEISRDPNFQLKLLDNYLEEVLRPLEKEEADILENLEENARQIQSLSRSIDEIQNEIGNLDSINEQLRRMEQENFVARLQEKSQFDREKELFDFASEEMGDLKPKLTSFLLENRLASDKFDLDKIGELPHKSLLERQCQAIQQIDSLLESAVNSLLQKIDDIQQQNAVDLKEWEAAYTEQEKTYQALLLEFQTDGSVLKPDRYIRLQKEQRRLQELSNSLQGLSEQLNGTMSSRNGLLNALRVNRHLQYEQRRAKAEELSKSLGNRVRITIWPQGNRNEFQNQLIALFEGTRTRRDVIETLVNVKADEPERAAQKPINYRGEVKYLVPEIPCFRDQIDLANAISNEIEGVSDEDSDLVQIYRITSSASRRNLSNLPMERLFELEVMSIPDLPIIELKVGNGDLGYKHLDMLSVGQKCTALLSLVLLESPAPLLIDQPEDDLDNHFIFDQIVTTLRSAKEKRQFLIATHNANIPVSGDAELIVVLDADERHGWIEEDGIGSIDTTVIKRYVEHILEGGENAFKIWKEKYGI